NGRLLEEYVEEFQEHYHKACWDDETLKQLFWSEIDDIIQQMLLLREDHLPFIEFIDYDLWVCGSSLTVGVAEEDATINFHSLEPSISPAAISLPTPERAHRPSPECPGNTFTTDPEITPMPPMELES
ncbi:hypothetical protein ABG768_006787, partial [Culter alburnus]